MGGLLIAAASRTSQTAETVGKSSSTVFENEGERKVGGGLRSLALLYLSL
jgi:hypothetical protein